MAERASSWDKKGLPVRRAAGTDSPESTWQKEGCQPPPGLSGWGGFACPLPKGNGQTPKAAVIGQHVASFMLHCIGFSARRLQQGIDEVAKIRKETGAGPQSLVAVLLLCSPGQRSHPRVGVEVSDQKPRAYVVPEADQSLPGARLS